MQRLVPVAIFIAVVAGACVGGGADVSDPVPTLFDDSTTIVEGVPDDATSSTVTTTTQPVADRLPPLSVDIPGAVISDDGTLLPVAGTDGEVWFVLGPCGDDRIEPASTATLAGPQHVVLDPGGETEAAALDLAVAQRTAEILRADGMAVALTRTGPVDMSRTTRGAIAPALGAAVFVSLHHPAPTTGTTDDPRPTVFHRTDDDQSRRLGGLIHQELNAALGGRGDGWSVHDEPGVRSLLNQRGEDYFGVLRASGGSASVRVDLLALGEKETTLLASAEGREIEAQALAAAIVRFLVTDEEGNGFVDAVEAVRTAPTSNEPDGCG